MVASPLHHRSQDDWEGKLHVAKTMILKDSPVHRGNVCSELASEQVFLFLCLDERVDALRFLKGWDASPHPGCAAGELVVGRKDWPVEGVFEWNQSIDCANRGVPKRRITIGVSIGLTLSLHPGGRDLTTTRGL